MGWTPPAVGQRGTWTKTFTTADVEGWARRTGDRNPLHFDEAFARRTRPGALIVHGGLTTGLFNALVAEVLPGPGSVFLHQEWGYPPPLPPGGTGTGRVASPSTRKGIPPPPSTSGIPSRPRPRSSRPDRTSRSRRCAASP